MPDGDVNDMIIFTKMMKPPFSLLRKSGHQSVVYVDKTFLIWATFIECTLKIDSTIHLLQLLGFRIQPREPVLTAIKSLKFLEYFMNSEKIILT